MGDQNLTLADVGRKAITPVRESLVEVFSGNLEHEQAEGIAIGVRIHGYHITPEMARELGPDVSPVILSALHHESTT